MPALDSVEEICGWLGTFNERLRLARVERVQAAELTLVSGSRFQPSPPLSVEEGAGPETKHVRVRF